MKLPVLDELLAYQNEQVVRYFCHHHPDISYQEGQQLFNDLLAWMWLNACRQKSHRLTYLFGPLLRLDEVWHCFILHTPDYVDFCQHYFADYFHHHVETIGSEHELSPDELADFLEDCFEYLGDAWVERHFPALD
ncbi:MULTISPECIES: hypothetical protein [unclassified Legionella]|uniref:hypothetical protein n=1 Tax=unclassified Legionella TaxID=2622702 RepID=UPI00105679A6|nr:MULTISPECIES: hypothetical protein [unclassified Legionella]MDI9817897.1 hypothetical protein [Legionella sp. PL877]